MPGKICNVYNSSSSNPHLRWSQVNSLRMASKATYLSQIPTHTNPRFPTHPIYLWICKDLSKFLVGEGPSLQDQISFLVCALSTEHQQLVGRRVTYQGTNLFAAGETVSAPEFWTCRNAALTQIMQTAMSDE